MSGLQKKVTNFFGTGSRKSKENESRQSTKSRSNAARRVTASRPKKSSRSAARRPPNVHSKGRPKTKTGWGASTSKGPQGSSRFDKAKVVKVHRPSSQSKSSKKGPHSRSNSQKCDVSKGALSKPQGSGSKPRSHSKQQNSCTKKLENVRRSRLTAIGVSTQKQPNDVRTSDNAERGADAKLTSSGRYQKLVMWCTKLGVFVTMLGQLGFIIYIFVIDILRDEVPTSTGLVLSLIHLMIIFLSSKVIFDATKSLCLFTCLADLFAILTSFIYIAITESSNNYLRGNLTVAKVLRQAVFTTAESCLLLMFNLCMVLTLYTEIRATSSTQIGVAVINMDLESADQEREKRADLEKASLTKKVGAFVPFLQMIRQKKSASVGGHERPLKRQGKMVTLVPIKTLQQTPKCATTDRSIAFLKSEKSSASTAPPPQPTPGKEISATVPASVLPGSEKSTTSRKPSPPKLTLPPTSSKQTPEKPRILAQNVHNAVSLDMAVPPHTTISTMTTPGGPLGSVQAAKLANETPVVVTATPQQATNIPEKPIASTITANVTGTPIAQNMVTPAADPSLVAANSARPPSFASGATQMRYLYEEKRKANQ
ncbi:unnamed protein product, partial [Mesorhabditis belari]|uniref:Uncharacterized protein n=1 Tax=Mesorhabditis belari TaxID=2138241 RepID=A0AAF3J2X2_9BILA